jgi:hypothetical protein
MGYSQMFSRLAVVNTNTYYSGTIPLSGGNAAQLDVVCFNLGGLTSFSCDVEGTNDGQNFTSITTNAGLVLGYSAPTKSTGIGFSMIRLKVTGTGTGTAIVSAGVNISHQ